MRHGKKRHKLGVTGPHRLALLANLSVALITHGRIKTTLAKAKALRPFIEKIITLAKKAENSNDAERKLHFRRLAISRLNNVKAVATLFDERVVEFMERSGGYTRIYKLGQRIGDAAEMGLIELIDGNDEGYAKRPSKKASTISVSKDSDATETEDVAESVDEALESGDQLVEEPVEGVDETLESEDKLAEDDVVEETAELETSETNEAETSETEDLESKDQEKDS